MCLGRSETHLYIPQTFSQSSGTLSVSPGSLQQGLHLLDDRNPFHSIRKVLSDPVGKKNNPSLSLLLATGTSLVSVSLVLTWILSYAGSCIIPPPSVSSITHHTYDAKLATTHKRCNANNKCKVNTGLLCSRCKQHPSAENTSERSPHMTTDDLNPKPWQHKA